MELFKKFSCGRIFSTAFCSIAILIGTCAHATSSNTAKQIGERIQAEDFDAESAPSNGGSISVLDFNGGQKVGFIDDNSWIKFDDVDFGPDGASAISLTWSKGNFDAGATIDVRLDSPNGPRLTTFFSLMTGDWNRFLQLTRPFEGDVTSVSGKRDLYLTFNSGSGIFVADVDSLVILASTSSQPNSDVGKRIQAENFDKESSPENDMEVSVIDFTGGETYAPPGANPREFVPSSGKKVGFASVNNWIMFDDVEFGQEGPGAMLLTWSKNVDGNASVDVTASVDVRIDSPNGPLLTTFFTRSSGGWNRFFQDTRDIAPITGTRDLYFVFKSLVGGYVADIDSFALLDSVQTLPDADLRKPIQAEDFDAESNPENNNVIRVLNFNGGQKVGFSANNSWIKFDDVDFGNEGASNIALTWSKGNFDVTARVDVRLDSPTGPLLTQFFSLMTGDWNRFLTLRRPFDRELPVVTGTRDIYFVYSGSGSVADLDSFTLD